MTNGYRGQVRPVIRSVDYDGKSVLELMQQWDKMPYNQIKMVIANKGGFIDDKGIIHKGIAVAQAAVMID